MIGTYKDRDVVIGRITVYCNTPCLHLFRNFLWKHKNTILESTKQK